LLKKFQNVPVLLDVSRVEYESKNKAFATLQTLVAIWKYVRYHREKEKSIL
jgi:hypothetical protein